MDTVLCDELLQEIFQRLPPSSSLSVSLVSKRWLFLLRSSTTSLSIRLPSSPSPATVSSLLSHYPFLSTLSLLSNHDEDLNSKEGFPPPPPPPPPPLSDPILLSLAASACSHHLSHLRFLPKSPVSPSALLSSSSCFKHLTALQISSLHPLSFRWLALFPSLKDFSLLNSGSKPYNNSNRLQESDDVDDDDDQSLVLPLETLSLSGIRASDRGMSWLWRHSTNLRRLQFRACEGTGDGPSSPSFARCLHGLCELELRTCRSIADRVLLLAADHCHSLVSLLLYDGGSRDALRQFIIRRLGSLHTLDLRLPLDLDNDHLSAIAADRLHRGGLTTLRLQSCCLVTGDGLRSLAGATAGAGIEELALVSCDVVEREPGLLTFLGQSLCQLRRFDLSHNEMLGDKEVGSMLASCRNLLEIRLRGCRGLTDAAMISILKYCGGRLEVVDVFRCSGITVDAIEFFILNTRRLNRIIVEESKVSEAAKAWASRKAIKIG